MKSKFKVLAAAWAWIMLPTATVNAAATVQPLDAGFYHPHELPEAPSNLERATAAAVELSSPGGLKCSASVVSPEGYLLTALHCVEDCLIRHHKAVRVSHPAYKLLQVEDQTPEIVCSSYEVEALGSRGVEVLATGRGLYYPEKSSHPESVTEADLRRLLDFEQDFAIVRVLPEGRPGCIPLAQTEPAVGDAVWGIGFPIRARRENGHASNGKNQYVRYGKVFDAVNRELMSGELSEQELEFWVKRYSSPRLLVTNLDTVGGNSGGMVIDRAGDLVGMTIESSSEGPEFLDRTSVELRVGAILEAARELLGAEKVDEIFACRQ